MITFKNSEIKIKDYDKYYSDNLNYLETNLNRKIFSLITSAHQLNISTKVVDEFYECTQTNSKTYKTLISFLFSRGLYLIPKPIHVINDPFLNW